MLFSALSLKVLVGLGTLVGVSFLSIHYTSKDTGTGTLNSQQGGEVVMPELDDPAMPEPEVAVTPEQKEILDKEGQREESRANSAAKKENTDSTIATIESEIEKLKQERQACYDEFTTAKRHYDELSEEFKRIERKKDNWTGNQDAWNNDKIDARRLRDEAKVNSIAANGNLTLKNSELDSKKEELAEAEKARHTNWRAKKKN